MVALLVGSVLALAIGLSARVSGLDRDRAFYPTVFHGKVIANPGTPDWWPHFCSAYDVVAAGFLAWLLRSRRIREHGLVRDSSREDWNLRYRK